MSGYLTLKLIASHESDNSGSLVSLRAALIIHAVGAPRGFAFVSRFCFRRFSYTDPLQTAAVSRRA